MLSTGCSSSIRRSYSCSGQIHINGRIQALIRQGHYAEALEAYSRNPDFRGHASRFTFPSLLKACASLSCFSYGGALQSAIIKMGFQSDAYIASSLVRIHVKRGCLGSAAKVFDEMPQCDVGVWNSVIDGYCKNGLFTGAMARFRRMQESKIEPDGYTVCILLGLSTGSWDSLCGREIHGYVMRNLFGDDPFVTTALIDMYSKVNRITDAWNVFDRFGSDHEIAVWNSMISGFFENGFWRNSLALYQLVKGFSLELGSTTLTCVLAACAQGEAVSFGTQLHGDVVKTGFESDPYVGTSLVTFYSKCGLIEDAEMVFYFTRDKKVDLEMWNSMISAYANCGRADDALDMFVRMGYAQVAPDFFTMSNVLIACSMIRSWRVGKIVHVKVMKTMMRDNVAVHSALLMMYSKFGGVEYACRVFNQIKEKDVVAWGSMICASCENKKLEQALDLYRAMVSDGVKPDANVMASVVTACAGLSDEKLGCCVQGLAVKAGVDSDAFMGSALIEFYSAFRQMDMAKTVFWSVLQRNLVVWNSMISCFCRNDLPYVAVSLLPQMVQGGVYPDLVSVTAALTAVSQMAALLKGKTLHGYYLKLQMPEDTQLENTLIDMYIKCGSFASAERVFQHMAKRDIVSWNSMISGYGFHGKCDKAMATFCDMVNSEMAPDEITFLALISSCSHCGFVDEGLDFFNSMTDLYKIKPRTEHYVNVVDLLGRSGRLQEAIEFIGNMAVAPERGVWLSMLSACRVHKNAEIGELAARKLMEMDPDRGSNYVQAINLYTEGGQAEKAAEVRGMMREKGVMKVPGCSWIEMRDGVEVFYSGDSQDSLAIQEAVEWLRNGIKMGVEYALEPEAGIEID